MIVFSYPTEDTLPTLSSLCPEDENGARIRSYLEEIVADCDEESDIAVCFCYDTFIIRRFFEEYEFSYPLAISCDADVEKALSEIEEYCKRHELPLSYGDLSGEDCALLQARYRNFRMEEFDISEEGEHPFLIYRLRVVSAVELLCDIPTLTDGTLVLDKLCEEDIANYALLCRDEEILAVWGYDYRDVDPDMCDRGFYEGVLDEFDRGISITFAVRYAGRFVGEAALYAFDGVGGCEASIRILRGYRRAGCARRALALLFDFAKGELGLHHVDGVCLSENTPSRALMSSMMEFVCEDNGLVTYRRVL